MLSYRRIRFWYQVVFFGLFCFFVYAGLYSWGEGFSSEFFGYLSGLSALGNIISQHNITFGLMLAILIAGLTLFFGRFFCGWICPMGIIQHFGASIFQVNDKSARYVRNTYIRVQKIKYIILIVFVFCAFFGVIISGWVDPISIITRFSVSVVVPVLGLFLGEDVAKEIGYDVTVITALIFSVAFLSNIYLPRFWCRTICPLGALLSIFSIRPLFRIVRDEEKCIHCGLCRQNCQGACEPDKKVIHSECLMCMTCIDVCPVGALKFGFSGESYQKASNERVTNEMLIGVRLSRRDFIVSGVLSIFALGILRNVRAVFGRGFDRRIRPPGSLAEENFLARCVRCGQCLNVCPTNVLQPALDEAGIEGLWTPVLKMQYGYCEYDCVRCSQVCPTGAIQSLSVQDKHEGGYDKIGNAFVDRSRCLPWAFGKECLVCQEVCPVSPKAIYFQYRRFSPEGGGGRIWMKVPYVDAERCIGCGACEYNCPVQDKPAIYITSIGEKRSTERKLLLSDREK